MYVALGTRNDPTNQEMPGKMPPPPLPPPIHLSSPWLRNGKLSVLTLNQTQNLLVMFDPNNMVDAGRVLLPLPWPAGDALRGSPC